MEGNPKIAQSKCFSQHVSGSEGVLITEVIKDGKMELVNENVFLRFSAS